MKKFSWKFFFVQKVCSLIVFGFKSQILQNKITEIRIANNHKEYRI